MYVLNGLIYFAMTFIAVRSLQQILLLRIHIFTSETYFFCMKKFNSLNACV